MLYNSTHTKSMAFPVLREYQLFPAESQVLPYFGSNQALYSVIVGATDNRHYAVVQTTAQLLALMNG
jgi:hypothetical protein